MDHIHLSFVVNGSEIGIFAHSQEPLQSAFNTISEYHSFSPSRCTFFDTDGTPLTGNEIPARIGWSAYHMIECTYQTYF